MIVKRSSDFWQFFIFFLIFSVRQNWQQKTPSFGSQWVKRRCSFG